MEEKDKKLIDYFYSLNKHGRIYSSYLFAWNNLGLVLDIAKLINCTESPYFCNVCDDCLKIDRRTHPDVFILDDEKSSIKIEAIREIQKFLSLKSFQSKAKVVIINYAHLLTEAASNAFLKTLEEPPRRCAIMLVSSRTDLMLPTILSRCRKIYLPHRERKPGVLSRKAVEFITNGNLEIKGRQLLSSFIPQLVFIMRDYISFKIYGNAKNFINRESQNLVSSLPYSYNRSVKILEEILTVYSAVSDVNVNLACNLLKLTFYNTDGHS